MSTKSYIDLTGLGHYHSQSIVDKISTSAYYEKCGNTEVAVAGVTYYVKSGDTYTAADPQPTIGTSVSSYYILHSATSGSTVTSPSVNAVEEFVEEQILAISGDFVQSIAYDSANHKLMQTKGGMTTDIFEADDTEGGTYQSKNLITSGAVNSGLASIKGELDDSKTVSHTTTEWGSTYASLVLKNGQIGIESDLTPPRMKVGDGTSVWARLQYVTQTVNDATITLTQNDDTLIGSFTLNQSSNKTIKLPELGKVDDVQVEGTSVVSSKVANITKSGLGLDQVGNFKAVSTVVNQSLTTEEKSNARTNISAIDAGGTELSCTIPVSGWTNNSITISCSGVKSTDTVWVGANPASFIEYSSCGIYATALGTNSITFSRLKANTNALTAVVVVMKKG